MFVPIKTLRLRNLCMVYERKTKDVHSHGPSNLNLGSLFAPLMFAGLLINFSLLTTISLTDYLKVYL